MTRKLLFSLAIAAIAAPLPVSASNSTTAKAGTTIGASTSKTGKDFRPKKKKKKSKHGKCEAFQR